MVKRGIAREHPAHRTARMLVLDMFTTLPFLQPWLRHMGEVRACPENGERLLEPRRARRACFPRASRVSASSFATGTASRASVAAASCASPSRRARPSFPVTVVGAEEIHPNLTRMDFIGRPLGLPYFPLTPTFPLLGPLGVLPLPTKWWIDIGKPIVVRPRARGRRPPDDRERARGPGALDAPDDDRLAPLAARQRLHGRIEAVRGSGRSLGVSAPGRPSCGRGRPRARGGRRRGASRCARSSGPRGASRARGRARRRGAASGRAWRRRAGTA